MHNIERYIRNRLLYVVYFKKNTRIHSGRTVNNALWP